MYTKLWYFHNLLNKIIVETEQMPNAAVGYLDLFTPNYHKLILGDLKETKLKIEHTNEN